MSDHVTISEQLLLKTPTGESSSLSTQTHIVIPMEEIAAAMEEEEKKKSKTSATNVENDHKYSDSEEDDNDAGIKGQCRYCLQKDYVNMFETPCSCNGSLKFAHRNCIQHWCNIKGDTTCEICRQPYGPNYAVTERAAADVVDDDVVVDDDEREEEEHWRIPGTNIRIYSPLELAGMASARFCRAMNEECNLRHPTGGVIFGVLLIIVNLHTFLGVLVLRDAYNYKPSQETDMDKVSDYIFYGLLLILTPLYILTWIFEWIINRGDERRRDLTE